MQPDALPWTDPRVMARTGGARIDDARAESGRLRDLAIAALLLLGVGYNFALAAFNANVVSIGPSAAYAVELAVYAGCFLFGLRTLGARGFCWC
jgi:hypothetical protein